MPLQFSLEDGPFNVYFLQTRKLRPREDHPEGEQVGYSSSRVRHPLCRGPRDRRPSSASTELGKGRATGLD